MSAIQAISERSLGDNQKLLQSLFREEHTSFSAVSTYLRCPRQFKYKYIQLEPPSFVADDLVFGIAFHRVVAGYYAHLKDHGEQLPVTKLVEGWEATFAGVVRDSKQPIRFDRQQDGLRELGKLMVQVFAETVRPRTIIGAEVPFSVEVHDPRSGEVLPVKLVGSIDLIEADDVGNIIVGELKTARKKWSEIDVDQNVQASVYSHVVSELGLNRGRDVLVRFDIVTKTKKPSMQQLFTTRSERDLQRALAVICDVEKAVEARCFHVNPGWACLRCAYRALCQSES